MPIDSTIIDRTLASKQGSAGYKAVETLADAGYDAQWVGGSVRDMLMGKVPHEIDIATSAKPEQVTALFKKNDDSAAALGSVIVSVGGERFEITTYRQDDDSSDGRRPDSVKFSTIDKDASRRDITISAMYWNPISQKLFDPHNGETDLREALIRFIGDPATRIKQDALRILRAVRMRATINGQYHPETYRALQENSSMISVLSGMRQLQEFEKMLLCPHPDRALEDLWELGALKHMLPELHACKGVPQPSEYHKEGDVWDHMMSVTRAFTDDHTVDMRLAAVFHDCGKPQTFSIKERIRFDHHAEVSSDLAKAAFNRLQMPGDRRDKIAWVIRHHMMMGTFEGLSDERKAHWYFHPWFKDLLQLFYLDAAGTQPGTLDWYQRIVDDYDAFLDNHPRPAKPLLKGEEIMTILALKPGERVGEIMKALHAEQLSGKIKTKAEAKRFVEGMKS